MSGHVTQRGELASADKYDRAKWAVTGGADLVVELPPQYVLTTASYFALGGVKIANVIKGEKFLSFGSESEDMASLQKVASFKENEDFRKSLNCYLKQGNGYAKSFSLAVKEYSDDYADILSSPNNILAIEYLRAIQKTGSEVSPINVARKGGNYLDSEYNEIYSSASAVRNMLETGDFEHIEKSVPKRVFEYLSSVDKDDIPQYRERLFTLIKYVASNGDLQTIHGVKEGIENRIKNAAAISVNLQEFWGNLRTKRYTDSYLSRTVTNMLLGNEYSTENLENEKIDHVNILAVEENSKALLSSFDCNVITKSSALPNDSLINSADRLYRAIYRKTGVAMAAIKR